jgi:OOP family OmpA-OmpF porin
MSVAIEGHADSTGPDAYNQKLSERRAKAVMAYLVNTVGIDPSRLTAVGYGESRPAYPNDTPENQAKNRRVEFTPAM